MFTEHKKSFIALHLTVIFLIRRAIDNRVNLNPDPSLEDLFVTWDLLGKGDWTWSWAFA